MVGQGVPDAATGRRGRARGYGTVVQSVLVVAGLIGVVALVRQLGAEAVLESLRRLPATLFVAVLALTAVEALVSALGWRFAFVRGPRLGRLLIAHLAGEALNGATPTGRLGGEAVKAWLVSGRVHMRDTIASLVIVKAVDVASQALFLLAGIIVAFAIGSVDRRLVNGMLVLLAVEWIATGGFIYFQARGGLARSGELLRRIVPVPQWAGRGSVFRLDRTLALYYRRHPLRFAVAIAFLLLNRACSTLETYLVFLALGVAAPLSKAVVVTAASSAIGFVTFFVPLDIGVREGGYVAASIALGLTGATGLTVSLVKRFTEVALWSVGLVALALARRGIGRGRAVTGTEVLAPEL